MRDWDEEFFKYLEEKGFNERWFFLASLQNLLLYVISGYSNKSVSNMVGMEEEYIQMACNTFLGFDGWEEDLDYSPWYQYKNDLLTIEENSDIMGVCWQYQNYRKELDTYYERDEIT